MGGSIPGEEMDRGAARSNRRGWPPAVGGALLLALVVVGGRAVAHQDAVEAPRVRGWRTPAPPEHAVDVVFVGDGYQKKHLSPSGKYWTDVNRYAKRFLEEPPMSWYRDSINVWAVFLESKDAGVDGDTALGCHFIDDRRVVFRNEKAVRAAVSLVPSADIALVMVNVERSGGCGTVLSPLDRGDPYFPAPTFSAQDTSSFDIALHELGHSFAGLADEYADSTVADEFPLPKDGKDLDFPNVTLASVLDATSPETIRKTAKWARFLDWKGADHWTWAYEGGYFREHGVYRPFPRCKMRDRGEPFCPLCCATFAQAICKTAGIDFDEAGYARKHPLQLWR